MHRRNFLPFGLLTAFLILTIACNTPSDAWTNFIKCGSNACVKEALAVKDAFLKDPKTTLGQFTATYEKGDDHVIGWLYLLRDSVLLNEKFSPTAERVALQQQLVEAARPFLDDPKLSEMAKSLTQEVENLAILAETEDKVLEENSGGDPAPANIIGRWKSIQDPKSEIEITDKEYVDIYDGKTLERNLYAYFKTCPKDCVPDTDEPCLRVSAQDDMCYTVLFADGKTLQLVYLGGTGKTLTFKRK